MIRVLVLLLALCLPAWAMAGGRVALVIGNSTYERVGRLTNPENDARDVGAALARAGFEVEYGFDLTLSQTLDVLKTFRARAARADAAVVYYAGHGIEVDRRNFMIPVDAHLASASDIEFETVPLDLTMGAVSGAAKLSLVVMDACRNNPFLAQMRRAGSDRAIGRGLGAVEPVGNTLVAYSAREGTVAADGDARNSPYAAALVKALGTDGLEIGKLFRQVRDDVLAATGGEQEPFLYGSLSASDWYFRPPRDAGPPQQPPATGGGDRVPEAEIELAFWKAVQQTDTPEAYKAYLETYPTGRFAPIAKLRMAVLEGAAGSRDGGTPAGGPGRDGNRDDRVANRGTEREVFRRTVPVHVGDERIGSWDAPQPIGRCFEIPLDHDGEVEELRVSFEPYGVEGAAVEFAGIRRIVEQRPEPGEKRPNYWGAPVELTLPVRTRIHRGDRMTICARRVADPDKPDDIDDFMVRRLVVMAVGP